LIKMVCCGARRFAIRYRSGRMSARANLLRRTACEALGAALLLATVVGSGIMAERLSAGNAGIALLGNTLATGAVLVVLLGLLGPVSGAHFNPLVSTVEWLRGGLARLDCGAYAIAQCVGAFGGVLLAHAMFELPLVQTSTHERAGMAQGLSEFVATFGLLFLIVGGSRARLAGLAWLVAAWITAGYWFTASTCFANPAVTLARSLTDTFSGIQPADIGTFVVGQLLGGACGALGATLLIPLAVEDPT
jgi:glycerol uptake facilitator-like aquaporin